MTVSSPVVKNLLSNSITLASADDETSFLNSDSTHAAISQTGTLVAFTSWATNLPGASDGIPAVYLRNLQTKQIINVSSTFMHFCPNAKWYSWPSFSPDGHYLVFSSVNSSDDPDFRGNCVARQNGACSLVLRDLQGNDIPVKSQVNQGQILEPSINSSGDYLSWDVAGNPQQVYACKLASGANSLS